MELLKHEEDLDLQFGLNDNKFIGKNICLNNDNNLNLNKTIDKTFFNNNINTNVTFDTELKPTYTVKEASKQCRGQYLDNKTAGFINNATETSELSKNNHINDAYTNELSDENETAIVINSKNINVSAPITDVNASKTEGITCLHNMKIYNTECHNTFDKILSCKTGDVNDNTDVNENSCYHTENRNNITKTDFQNTITPLIRIDEPKVDNTSTCANETNKANRNSEDKGCERTLEDCKHMGKKFIKAELVEEPIKNLLCESKNETANNELTRAKSNDTTITQEPTKQEYKYLPSNTITHEFNERSCNEFSVNEHENKCVISRTNDQSNLKTSKSMDTIQRPFTHNSDIQKPAPQQLYSPQEPCGQLKSNGRHNKFLNTLRQINEQKKQRHELEFLKRGKTIHSRDAYKKPRHIVAFEDDESPLHTINYAPDKFNDAYLSGYQDRLNVTRISPGCVTPTGKQYGDHRNNSRKPSRTPAIRTTDGKENNHSSFDVYNIETSLPYIDLEAIECHLRAATKEERRRRNDREEIRKRLANGTDPEHLEKGARRKPNLQTRLQNGMNLQICFMNETASDDNESPGSDAEPKSLPSKNKSCHVVSSKQAQSLSCQISNTNKTNHKYTRPSPNKLTLPLKNVYTSNKVSSVADFFARQAELQVEARKALSESKDNARKLMQEERETHPVSPITEIIRTSLHKVGITFPKDRRRLSRQLLTDMNVAQLQVIVNDLHTQIEYLNEKLVRYLMERDELHMTQDSMLVDIEDLTRYLSAKQKNLKQESIQNNNNHSTSIMFNSLKPQMNRIATLVKK